MKRTVRPTLPYADDQGSALIEMMLEVVPLALKRKRSIADIEKILPHHARRNATGGRRIQSRLNFLRVGNRRSGLPSFIFPILDDH